MIAEAPKKNLYFFAKKNRLICDFPLTEKRLIFYDREKDVDKMKREFEVVSQGSFPDLNVFLVQMVSRTPHIHKEIELGLVIKGEVAVKENGRIWTISENGMYLINAMEPHEFAAKQPDTLILAIQASPKLLRTFLPDAAMRRYQTEPSIQSRFREEDYAALTKDCIRLARRYHRRDQGYEVACFALIGQIFLLLETCIPIITIDQRDYDAARRRTERMARITDYMDQHYQQKLLLGDIADKFGLTLTYASHLFKDTLGVTFQDYLKEKRFEHALPLMTGTSRSLLDISLESGFSDERYLSALFLERFGLSPREYRKRLNPRPNVRMPGNTSLQRILDSEEALQRLSQFD